QPLSSQAVLRLLAGGLVGTLRCLAGGHQKVLALGLAPFCLSREVQSDNPQRQATVKISRRGFPCTSTCPVRYPRRPYEVSYRPYLPQPRRGNVPPFRVFRPHPLLFGSGY